MFLHEGCFANSGSELCPQNDFLNIVVCQILENNSEVKTPVHFGHEQSHLFFTFFFHFSSIFISLRELTIELSNWSSKMRILGDFTVPSTKCSGA